MRAGITVRDLAAQRPLASLVWHTSGSVGTVRAPMTAPKITLDDVRHVAKLAALSLTPDEEARMVRELGSILGLMESLAGLDVTDVPPTFHAVPLSAALRPDRVRPSTPRAELLQAAPAQEDGGFAVPKVMDGEA